MIWCWLIGHKYLKIKGGFIYSRNACYRCGKPAG